MQKKIFNGERLKSARQYRGLTTDELAKNINASKQSISQYETGNKNPDFARIAQIATALEFPTEYFMLRPRLSITPQSTYFRAQLTTSKKYRTEQIRKMEHLAYIYKIIADYVEFPAYGLPDLSSHGETPEYLAQLVRNHLKIGNKPIQDIIPLLEERGVIITSFLTGTDKIDAFSHRVKTEDDDVYIIALSSNKESATRKHFDVAHELGHIIMHGWSEDVEALGREEFRIREKEANDFAAAFLLPRETFLLDVVAHPIDIDYYIQLKKKWKVSMSAMMMRAYHLEVITYNQYQYMMKTMQKKGYRVHEPLDDKLVTAPPSMLKNALELLFDENIFDAKEFMQELVVQGLPMHSLEVEILLGLVEDYLRIPDEKLAKIIPFNLKTRQSTNLKEES